MPKQIVIIGAVAAGMSAASKIRRLNPDFEINVYTDEQYISYAACGIPYYLSGMTKDISDLIARTPEEFAAQNINVHMGYFVEKIVPEEKKVVVKGQDKSFEKKYDKLLIATGAGARKINFKNGDLKNIHTLRNLTDGIEIKKVIDKGVKKAVIVGAGYIGVEMVETFKRLGIETTIIEAGDRVLGNFDEEISEAVREYIDSEGIKVFLNEKVTGFEGENGVVKKVITENASHECDLVILTLGSVPNSKLAEEAGIELIEGKAIKVNQYMETNIPDIYAAGDCASHYHVVKEKDVYIPLGTTANKQGRIAGNNMAGGREAFSGIAGTAITKIINMGVARTGLSKKEAIAEGIPAEEVIIDSMDLARYYPEHNPVKVKLIGSKESKKLIGAQIIGQNAFAKRIDVLALAVQNGIKVEDLADTDMAYAPPFAPVWDPFLIAAGILKDKL
ncbi:MAG: FAD-dependent oxidoreductase [Eubacteriales bacterium]|nr:FAD-dependent oxidoreductase [Eubacteriales bacterium]